MNQCVPSWDQLDDPAVACSTAGAGGFHTTLVSSAGGGGGAHHRAAAVAGQTFSPVVVPMSDQSYYEVAELTWEKGNISSHGLLNRPNNKYGPSSSQQLPAAAPGGDRETLEAVVGEAAARSHFPQQQLPATAPWRGVPLPADALVPCARPQDEQEEEETRRKRARVVVCASQGSVAPGTTTTMLALDVTTGDVCGFTTTTNNNSTSLDRDDDNDKGSPDTENTSIGGGAASDSRCFSRRSQRDGLCDEGENVVINVDPAMRSSVSTKRSRAAAIHNESERKRRDRINQKMKTLQKLVPNSSKTDKASMLDEVIDYLKQLQAQVQVMSRMSSMMMPMAMPQLQMSVMAQMAQMAQMAHMAQGMMNMGSLAQPGYAVPPMMHPPPFIPMPSWDASAAGPSSAAGAGAAADRTPQLAAGAMPDAFAAFLACQQAQQNGQQPGSMEAYNRMLTMCQKLSQQQQSQPSNSKQ